MQQLSPLLTVRSIFANQDASEFFNYLDKPRWFLSRFIPEFNIHRQKTQGVIYLAIEDNQTLGSIYFEGAYHLSYGHPVPTFGWLKAESESITHRLLDLVEQKARSLGFSEIRGPINPPKTFGGWGVFIKPFTAGENFDLPAPLIECADNSVELATWIESSQYTRDAEYINLINTKLLEVPEFPEIELTSPPIDHILNDQVLLHQIGNLVHGNFGAYLPDVSYPERAIEVLQLLKNVPHPDDFYFLARYKPTGALIGYILEIPNLFQLWAGMPITMSNIDSVILAKEYRGLNFFHFLFNKLTTRMHARGIIHREGTMIWTVNKPALASFTKIGYELRRFIVFRKNI